VTFWSKREVPRWNQLHLASTTSFKTNPNPIRLAEKHLLSAAELRCIRELIQGLYGSEGFDSLFDDQFGRTPSQPLTGQRPRWTSDAGIQITSVSFRKLGQRDYDAMADNSPE
jgi:hypothetical protein